MIHFGTGGWRAIIGDEFIKDNICQLAQAIAEDMPGDTKGIVIGYDRRFLSDLAAKWTAEVFAGNGITVHFIDRIAPTPLIMYGVKSLGTKYGMAITASHNPAEYNGIKVFTEGGRDADPSYTDVFEKTIAKGVNVIKIPFDEGVKKGLIKVANLYNKYIDSIVNMINIDAIRNKNLRIVLDPMFGVGRTSLETVLMTARCDVESIHGRHDPMFGGRLPSPSAATLSELRNMVVEGKFDLGIGTDGDADRIGIIDDKGTFIHPNDILALLYYYLLKYKGWKGDVVRNLATTHILDRIAEDYGFKCHEVPVGFKYISSKMEETDSLIGGESSGGLTIRGHIKGKDGIFAASLLVEMISVTNMEISQMLEEIHGKYGRMAMAEFDTRFSDAKKNSLLDMLFAQKLLPDFENKLGFAVEKVSYLDGCKVYFKNGGWIIIRFSGTEPLLRVFCEMEDVRIARKVIDLVKEFIK